MRWFCQTGVDPREKWIFCMAKNGIYACQKVYINPLHTSHRAQIRLAIRALENEVLYKVSMDQINRVLG